jgi:hypothetical protein
MSHGFSFAIWNSTLPAVRSNSRSASVNSIISMMQEGDPTVLAAAGGATPSLRWDRHDPPPESHRRPLHTPVWRGGVCVTAPFPYGSEGLQSPQGSLRKRAMHRGMHAASKRAAADTHDPCNQAVSGLATRVL